MPDEFAQEVLAQGSGIHSEGVSISSITLASAKREEGAVQHGLEVAAELFICVGRIAARLATP
jgi:hypothetical protein